MEAIRLLQPRQFALEEIPEPSSPDAGMALIRVRRIGICGSDYSGYLGKMPFFSYPRIPGHELGVEVLATGGCRTARDLAIAGRLRSSELPGPERHRTGCGARPTRRDGGTFLPG